MLPMELNAQHVKTLLTKSLQSSIICNLSFRPIALAHGEGYRHVHLSVVLRIDVLQKKLFLVFFVGYKMCDEILWVFFVCWGGGGPFCLWS